VAGAQPNDRFSVDQKLALTIVLENAVENKTDVSDTSGRLIAASKVSGTTVYDTAGEKLGSIYDVMIDKITGRTQYAIMSFGGIFGIGDSYHPLPWEALTYDEDRGGYVVNIDRSRLEGAPAYSGSDRDMWADPNYATLVNSYYGI
jgi:sporulation protein YlmC with PRC-barrel domain